MPVADDDLIPSGPLKFGVPAESNGSAKMLVAKPNDKTGSGQRLFVVVRRTDDGIANGQLVTRYVLDPCFRNAAY